MISFLTIHFLNFSLSAPVRAEDRDSGSNGEVRYALVEEHLEEEPLFTLDPFSGWLALNRELGE